MCIKPRYFKIIAWLFVLCGFVSYLAAWVNTFTKTSLFGIDTTVYFYDAMTAVLFGLFFLLWALHLPKGKK